MKQPGKAHSQQHGRAAAGVKWLAVVLLICPYAGARADNTADNVLRSDTPKLDNTIPKSSTMLKGGVVHHEKPEAGKPPPKLSTGASTGKVKGGLGRLFSGSAKADKTKPLRATAANNDSKLDASVESGVGIIGVKFVLAFGRPPVINRVFPGTPAANVGLRNGDVIVAVDGVPTFGLSKEEVYQMIVGTPGTPVTLSVSRAGDFIARTMNRMDFNDLTDPAVRRDYLLNM
ncbi:MAG: S41 family peptidase [Terriglobales bacterium]